MRVRKAVILSAALLFGGCNKIPPPFSSEPSPVPEFELRDFVVTVDSSSSFSNGRMSIFKGTGILVAKNVSSDKNLLVYLEVRNKTKGANSNPDIRTVFVRGGIGKVSVGGYTKPDERPDYEWSIIGWYELNKATLKTATAQ